MKQRLRQAFPLCCVYLFCLDFTAAAQLTISQAPVPGEVATVSDWKFVRDVAYGQQSESQKLDILYLAKPDKVSPAILYIHGGGWGGGDKGDDPDMMMQMLNGFAADGFVALSINYRLSEEAPFPAAIEDCKLAIRWLRAHAEAYGVDKSRIGVAGGSAGGHLAAMLAVTDDEHGLNGIGGYAEESSTVQAAASVSGPTDLQINLCASQQESRYKMVSDFLGCPLSENMALARCASPISYIRRDLPPTLFVHCKDDLSIDAEQSIRMADALKRAGAPTQLLLLEGTNHGSDMARTEPVLTELRKFFRQVLQSEVPRLGGSPKSENEVQERR